MVLGLAGVRLRFRLSIGGRIRVSFGGSWLGLGFGLGLVPNLIQSHNTHSVHIQAKVL